MVTRATLSSIKLLPFLPLNSWAWSLGNPNMHMAFSEKKTAEKGRKNEY